MSEIDYPGISHFPLGSAWVAKKTALNEAQRIPGGSKFRIVYGCHNFFSLYSESFDVDNLKVPRAAFALNFQQDYSRPHLTAGFLTGHYGKEYKTSIR